jgi:uncharacterized membrane protein
MNAMHKLTAVLLVAIMASAIVAIAATPLAAFAAEVNPAHDADNGNGNEKSLGTCKQEANNDQACIAKK